METEVHESNLVAGDHIYYWSSAKGVAYSHHGIYIGKNKVVHFVNLAESTTYSDLILRLSGLPADSTKTSHSSQPFRFSGGSSILFSNGIISPGGISKSPKKEVPPSACKNPEGCKNTGNGVVSSCLACFRGENKSLCRFQYGVSAKTFEKQRGGTCTTAISLLPTQVIYHACYLLAIGFGNYDLCRHNCEDFALYCKTGLLVPDKSSPGTSGQVNFVRAAFEEPSKHREKRYMLDIGVRKDVRRVTVETVASFLESRENEA